MQDVAVVTDSLACVPRQLMDRYGILIMPIRIVVQGKVYRDLVDITPSQAYELFLRDPEQFSTSPSSPGDYLEAYREARKMARNTLCVTVSSRLSTSYNVAMIAREQARTECPQSDIAVLDSQTVTASEGLVALAAARAASDGKGLTEVTAVAEQVRDNVFFFAVLDTIKYVYRTGRIPRVAAGIGAMLDIKPILTSSSGAIHLKGIVRSREQGERRLIETMHSKAGERPVHVVVMHAYAPDKAEELKERVLADFNCAEIWVSEFSPVMGYATGTGTLGLAFYTDHESGDNGA